jgi:uncharacterized repeat protein (TIGR02543 family)
MNAFGRKLRLPALALAAAVAAAGCPLPYDYNGAGGGNSHSQDPSTPRVSAQVTVSCTEQGGTSAPVADGGTFVSGKTTTVTLSTATGDSVIFYTDDGSAITNPSSAKKINGSSGTIEITRTTALQTVDIHAIAIGPSMLPSLPIHVTVSVTPYPVLSIATDKASVSENGGTATFTITASGAPAADTTVNLKTAGDYSTSYLAGLSGNPNTPFTATLAHGTTTITVPITAVHDPGTASRTVTLTIEPDLNSPPAYTVGTPLSASVVLQDDGSHTVTYNGNGSGGGTAPTDTNYYVLGATVTVKGQGSLVKTGYSFVGWNTQSDGNGTAYAPNATLAMPGSNVTLYAVWNVIQYTLTVISAGNGTTNPAGARTVTYGAATSIAATPIAPYVFLNWTVAAGTGVTFGSTGAATSTSANDTVALTGGNVTVQANFFIGDYYVNVATGNDSNGGTTSATAFKTITRALSVATTAGQRVNVAAGTYTAATGESFPLYIPAEVTLTGNVPGQGSGVVILGGGEPSAYSGAGWISNTVVMENQSVLEGFTVTNNSGLGSFPQGVLLDSHYVSNGAVVRNNTITGSPGGGIYVNGGSSGGSIHDNIVTANPHFSLAFVGSGGSGTSVYNNTFGDLVDLDTLGPDLGGGAAGSPGHNSFVGAADPTYFGCGGTVYAENNHWNNNPPTVGSWGGGFDVGIANSTTVYITGSY